MNQELIHEILPVGWLQCNCHVVGDAESREAIVIDPGDEVGRILAVVARHDLKVRAIVVTHAHIDHVGGLRRIHQATGAPVFMHPDDLPLYSTLEAQAAWCGMAPPEKVEVDGLLREDDMVRWGRYQARVIHARGHSQGSVCLYLPSDAPPAVPGETRAGEPETSAAGTLFAGDTLFAGSIGRTDLPGGSFEQILRSIHGKLLVLPEDTVVYPGHGPATTIGQEKETNPFLQPRIRLF